MNDRPTPETDAMIAADQHHLEDDNFFPASVYWRMCDVARTLERERDAARNKMEGIEHGIDYATNALMREKALSDRLASEVEDYILSQSDLGQSMAALNAWKEARK